MTDGRYFLVGICSGVVLGLLCATGGAVWNLWAGLVLFVFVAVAAVLYGQ